MYNKVFNNWKTFLNETDETLLIEGRLQDTKKKYPSLDKRGAIDKLSKSDPSGKNKYLMWMAKAADQLDTGEQPVTDGQLDLIIGAVKLFDKNAQRLDKKDINQFKSLQDLKNTVDKLGISKSAKKKQKRAQAMEGSEIIHEDDDVFIIRPYTKEASCHYGQKTKWCISATYSDNYFDRYTSEGKAFYFVLMKNLQSEEYPYDKVALVYNRQGELEEVYDSEDNEVSSDGYMEALLANHLAPAFDSPDQAFKRLILDDHMGIIRKLQDKPSKENQEITDTFERVVRFLGEKDPDTMPTSDYIGGAVSFDDVERDLRDGDYIGLAEKLDEYFDIIETSDAYIHNPSSHAMENPAGFDEEKLREAVADAQLKHIDVYYDDYDGEGNYMWEGNWYIDLNEPPFAELQWIDSDGDLSDDPPDELEDEIRELIGEMADSGGIYVDEIESEFYGTDARVYIKMTPDYNEDARNGIDGFTNFLVRMGEYDDNIEDITQEILDHLVEKDMVHSKAFAGAKRMVDEMPKFKNFKASYEKGHAIFEYEFNINMGNQMKNIAKHLPDFPKGRVEGVGGALEQSQLRMIRRFENDFRDRMFNPASNILKKMLLKKVMPILEASWEESSKQLTLPGIEARLPKKPVEPISGNVLRRPDEFELQTGNFEVDWVFTIPVITSDNAGVKKLIDDAGQDWAKFVLDFMKHVDDNMDIINDVFKEVTEAAIIKLAETRALSTSIMDLSPDMRENKMKNIYGGWRNFLKE
tara:strand:+ start:1510 stop:3762 length:2253 start_codon:yes stop_codon:yes gene_type:complete